MKIKDLEKIRLAELIFLIGGSAWAMYPDSQMAQEIFSSSENLEFFTNTLKSMSEIRDLFPNKDLMTLLSVAPFYADSLFYGSRLEYRTQECKKINELYNGVLDNTSSLMKTFCLDKPISIFAMYIYLYRNGFLSYNHEFEYNFHLKDLPQLCGADVLNGNGVCRSIASNLSDVYNRMGYESETFVVYTSSEACRGLEHLCPTPLSKTEVASKVVKMISTATGIIHFPNHLILNVKQNGINYTLDPTNDGMLIPNGKNLLVPTNPNARMILSPNSTRLQRRVGQLRGRWSLKGLREDLQLATIDIEEYRQIYLETLKLCRENPDVLEQFYLESQELYEEVHNIMEQQRGLCGRKFPIVKIKR